MPFTTHYAECPRCHRITGHPTLRAAELAEQRCLQSHEEEPRMYVNKHDPRVRSTL